jgi:hypothetical protein
VNTAKQGRVQYLWQQDGQDVAHGSVEDVRVSAENAAEDFHAGLERHWHLARRPALDELVEELQGWVGGGGHTMSQIDL